MSRPIAADASGPTSPEDTVELTYVEAVRWALREALVSDPRVFLLGEDIGARGGVFRVTDGLLAEFGPQRVIDTPIAESVIVGLALGAAAAGMRPVAEIQFADYVHPAADQLINEVAKLRYRSHGGWGCPLVVRMPYGAGVHGGPYHSQSVEALYFHVPGLKLVAPATPRDARGLLLAAIDDPDPVLFFEHKRLYRRVRGTLPRAPERLPLGRAAVVAPGDRATVVSYGASVHEALRVAAALQAEGIAIEVIDLRTLVPLDVETVLASVRKTSRVLVYHEDTRRGGIGAEIAATIAEAAFEYLDAPPVRLAAPDCHVPFAAPLEEAYLPLAPQLLAALRRLLAY
ncbi:MAG: alpha-ketoacid dehydrogenase subunit beta [Chloroflexi bacterium]|jgi:2-oxoisovalerate dehydrogenase E1 component beta subunit|nr:alpha-ketoacid dehydrogenase subunit beta [Chloroflexota bacterium]